MIRATPGTWSGGPTSFTYQWQRCSHSHCRAIKGAVGRRYRPSDRDIGHRLVSIVTAAGPGGFGTASSTPTALVDGAGALGDVQVLSSAADGTPANRQSDSPVLSPDGTRVAFTSTATNLTPGADDLGPVGLYVKDLRTGAITLAYRGGEVIDVTWSPDDSRIAFTTYEDPGGRVTSEAQVVDLSTGVITPIALDGVGGPGLHQTRTLSWSPDGSTLAVELTTTAYSSTANVYLVDLATGDATPLNSGAGGDLRPSASFGAVWSPDGTRVAFGSTSSLQWPYGAISVEVKDLTTGALTLASSAADGTPANRTSGERGPLAWSPDGSRLLFESEATNLLPVPPHNFEGLFVKNLDTGKVTLVTSRADGTPVSGGGFASWSPDGRSVAFLSGPGLVDQQIHSLQVFVKNLETGAVTLVSSAPDGTPGNDYCDPEETPVWSPDGARVLFESAATNLIPNAPTPLGIGELYVRDMSTGAVTLVSSSADGRPEDIGTDGSLDAQWTPDGAHIVFASSATNLAPVGTDSQSIFEKTLATAP